MCRSEGQARVQLERVIKHAGAAGDGWWVLNSIVVLHHDGESDVDLLVGIPDEGLLIIEVKGWSEFSVDSTGRWSYPGNGGPVYRRSPYLQASDQVHTLLQVLNDAKSNGRLAKGELPRIGRAVLFGGMLASGAAANQQWIGPESPFTLFRDDICVKKLDATKAVGILDRLRDILRANPLPTRPAMNDRERQDQIRIFLEPSCRHRDLAVLVGETHSQLNQVAESVMEEKAHDYRGDCLYVSGAAGTGKTVFALQLALDRQRRSELPSLYVCFSPALAAEIREVGLLDGSDVLVFTPEELLIYLGGHGELEQFQQAEASAHDAALDVAQMTGIAPAREIPRAYLGDEEFSNALLTRAAERDLQLGAVVVDEAQDLWEPLFSTLAMLPAPSDEKLFAVFVDPNQTTRRERAGLPWAPPMAVADADRREFFRNYRNGEEIIEAVEHQFPELTYERPSRGAPPATVNKIEVSTEDDLVDKVEEVGQSLRAAGLDPVLLVTAIADRTFAAMSQRALHPRPVDEFKGLERRSIILAVGSNQSPLDPSDEDAYVGMTRATSFLTLITCT